MKLWTTWDLDISAVYGSVSLLVLFVCYPDSTKEKPQEAVNGDET